MREYMRVCTQGCRSVGERACCAKHSFLCAQASGHVCPCSGIERVHGCAIVCVLGMRLAYA